MYTPPGPMVRGQNQGASSSPLQGVPVELMFWPSSGTVIVPYASRQIARVTMKNKPCAFCGSVEKDNPRTKGHVLQKSMYPEAGPESIRRITVPECVRCKAI